MNEPRDPRTGAYNLQKVEERPPDAVTILHRLRARFGPYGWAFLHDPGTSRWTALGPRGAEISRRDPTSLHAAVEAAQTRPPPTGNASERGTNPHPGRAEIDPIPFTGRRAP
ncbi:hypothetical protein [Actinomadura sp. 6N118]|uniref:hypothetical protein n=1 Tax=Actinomadura sp. 6N118 TaxID=3375151 RepID=UPI0037891916